MREFRFWPDLRPAKGRPFAAVHPRPRRAEVKADWRIRSLSRGSSRRGRPSTTSFRGARSLRLLTPTSQVRTFSTCMRLPTRSRTHSASHFPRLSPKSRAPKVRRGSLSGSFLKSIELTPPQQLTEAAKRAPIRGSAFPPFLPTTCDDQRNPSELSSSKTKTWGSRRTTGVALAPREFRVRTLGVSGLTDPGVNRGADENESLASVSVTFAWIVIPFGNEGAVGNAC